MPPGQGVSAGPAVDPMYLCPITTEVMDDPVIAADGYTYERSAIEEWFKKRCGAGGAGGAGGGRVYWCVACAGMMFC